MIDDDMIERTVELFRMGANHMKSTKGKKHKSRFFRDLWLIQPTLREWRIMRAALKRFWGHPENDDRLVLAIFRQHEARFRKSLLRDTKPAKDRIEDE